MENSGCGPAAKAFETAVAQTDDGPERIARIIVDTHDLVIFETAQCREGIMQGEARRAVDVPDGRRLVFTLTTAERQDDALAGFVARILRQFFTLQQCFGIGIGACGEAVWCDHELDPSCITSASHLAWESCLHCT